MKFLALGLLLTLQPAEPDLVAERQATLRHASPHALFTVVATWADGSPVNKGWISCDGHWFKYADEKDQQISEFGLWFKTDARGAAIFNPAVGDADTFITRYAPRQSFRLSARDTD